MDEIKVIDVKMYEVWIRRRILGHFKTKNKLAPIYKSNKRTKTLFAEVSQALT